MPSINDEILILEALEEAAQAAVKVQSFAFLRYKTTAIRKQSSIVWVVTKVEYVYNYSLLLSNEFSNSSVIVPKDIINQCAQIRYALNEGPNADSAQKLLHLLQQHDYIIELLKTQHRYLMHLFFSHIEVAKHTAKCSEVLIVDSTYKMNVYKYLLVSAVGVSNIANEKGSLKTFQIAMAWIENENKDVFMSDRDKTLCNVFKEIFSEADKMLYTWHLVEQNLKINCYKLFENDDDYLEFKKVIKTLQLAFNEEHIKVAMKSITNAAKKAYDLKKSVIYVETLMEDSKLWIYAFTKNYCHMSISITAYAESSYSAFKHAIETASELETVFKKIDQQMRMQHLKVVIHT
ncbi:21320_t:CDS:2, partial [Cetraspora pellucida]